MTTKKRNFKIMSFILVIFISIFIYKINFFKQFLSKAKQKKEAKIYGLKRNKFILKNEDEIKLINSAIKQNYSIIFSGNIINFDTLIIGKGEEQFNSSYILISKESINFNRITDEKKVTSYEHKLKLTNNLEIRIDRLTDSTIVTIKNEGNTLKFVSDFVGMNNPFIRSIGSTINVDNFEFIHFDYNSDIFVFGDSYVNCSSSNRWPFYIYKSENSFLCDGLPGGKSNDSYDFMNSALSVNKPKYIIWCLGMNDGSDKVEINANWKYFIKKIMSLCNKNNITLILSTVPSVPSIDNSKKNKFVRESGYRFIEFDKAVSDGKGNWKKDMLSKDGIHPTDVGAKAMAERITIDFPEIKNIKNKINQK